MGLIRARIRLPLQEVTGRLERKANNGFVDMEAVGNFDEIISVVEYDP